MEKKHKERRVCWKLKMLRKSSTFIQREMFLSRLKGDPSVVIIRNCIRIQTDG